MGEIKNQALGLLGKLYGFPGGQSAPNSVDLTTDVQVVHDVSREAELQALTGADGFGYWQFSNSHAVAGNLNTYMNPYQVAVNANLATNPTLRAGDISIWLMGAHVEVDPALVDSRVGLALTYEANSGGIYYHANLMTIPLWYTDSVAVTSITVRDWNSSAYVDLATNSIVPAIEYPYPIFDGARITLTSDLTGAGEVAAFPFFWIGRKGTTPPGMR